MSSNRLAALLNMLASDNDGERANAARMIATMAKKEGKLVSDFVMTGGSPQIIYRDRIVEKPVYRDRPAEPFGKRTGTREFDDIITKLRDIRRHHSDILDAWEEQFIDDVATIYSHEMFLTPRQVRSAEKIIRKAMRNEGEPLI